jgi:signal transduction histidine kinase
LEISDTGCGIPQESLARIFDRFYRVDSSRNQQTGGYGLGLAIAQQIAHAHNGRIAASSIPGEGTTMHLSLPKNSISG